MLPQILSIDQRNLESKKRLKLISLRTETFNTTTLFKTACLTLESVLLIFISKLAVKSIQACEVGGGWEEHGRSP